MCTTIQGCDARAQNVKADADYSTCIRLYSETVSNGLYLRSNILRSTILSPDPFYQDFIFDLDPYSVVLYRNCIFMMPSL